MEKSLSSWEAQKGLSDAADSLGLLDKTKASAWEVSRLQRDSEVPRCMIVGTALLRLVALSSCYIIGTRIGSPDSYSWDPFFGLYDTLHHCTYLKLYTRMLAMTLPFLTCFLILLWEMLSCCCCLCCRKHRRSFKIRPRPTQLWYRTYLGVQGCYYAFKVAALQFLTVVMQGLAKASLFRNIQDTHGSESLRASTAVHCFMVLLLCNILFPAMILVIPNYVFSRVGAALLDAVLDVGYMVTSIWLYIVFTTTESLTDIFLSSFLNYMSIYICIAHVLCVCRSLETADWIALFQVPRAAPNCQAWKRMICSSAYALALLAFVGIPLGGLVLGAFSDAIHSDAGLCPPPCQCSTVAPTSLLLERCVIPTGYVAQGVPDILEFNLTNLNITEVLPDAFIARGAHQKVRSISLRGNHLTELPEGLFRDLLQQEEDDWRNDIDTVDLADNGIATLPRTLFHAGSSGGLSVIRELHLEGNCLTTLPPGVFHGLTFRNHGDYYGGTLDMSRNKLQVLPPKIFEGLELERLYLQDNNLIQLHAETFQGHTFDRYCSRCILNISQNRLQALPPKIFDGLELNQLSLQSNDLSQLHPETFHGLTFSRWTCSSRGSSCILDISRNKLQDLPGNVFYGLQYLRSLDLAENELVTLPDDVFDGLWYLRSLRLEGNRLRSLDGRPFYSLIRLEELNLEQNQLTDLDEDVFDDDNKRSLLDLKLGGNRLTTLPGGLFNGFRKLRNLQLQSNQLVRLPPKLFQTLRA